MSVTNVLVAGVGGQGVILASELIALAALADGRDVKQGEFHGVAQRGGAVFSHVRFGDRVHSPMTPRGGVDFFVALEKLESLRYGHYVRPGGTILVNDHAVEPVRMADQRPYPDNALAFLEGKGFRVVAVPATSRAIDLGSHKAANVVMLGALAAGLDIPRETWMRTLEERIPAGLLPLNQAAFEAGEEVAAGIAASAAAR